jgi:predicted PurR-regulated permease PerM
LQRVLGGRGTLFAILFSVVLLAFLILPMVSLAETLIDGVQTLASHLKDGNANHPTASSQRRNLANHRLVVEQLVEFGVEGPDRGDQKFYPSD